MSARQRYEILSVLIHYGLSDIPLKEWGWQKISCPFHDDSRASAGVNQEDNCFKCHGCSVQGDAIAVIMQHEGIDFRTASAKAAEISSPVGAPVRRQRRPSYRLS